MMEVVGGGALKRAEQLQFGELFVFKGGGGNVLAVCLGDYQGRKKVGVLQGGSHAGRYLPLGMSTLCYSYGSDWVLDVSKSTMQSPGPLEGEDKPGVFLDDSGPCMVFAGGAYEDIAFFNLKTEKSFDSWPMEVVKIDNFAIWRNISARDSGVEEPIFKSTKPIVD